MTEQHKEEVAVILDRALYNLKVTRDDFFEKILHLDLQEIDDFFRDSYPLLEPVKNVSQFLKWTMIHTCMLQPIKLMIEKEVKRIESTPNVKFQNDSLIKLVARFAEYESCKIQKTLMSIFSEALGINKNYLELYTLQFQEILAFLNKEGLFKSKLRDLKPHRLKSVIDNEFYEGELSTMENNVKFIESIHKNISEKRGIDQQEINKKLINVSKEKWGLLSSEIFSGILDDFEITGQTRSKSTKKRILFPIFQMTHPERCHTEEEWEKSRGFNQSKKEPTTNQSYKDYQVSVINKIIGE